jgi:ATP:ADP antiporter, AAA family
MPEQRQSGLAAAAVASAAMITHQVAGKATRDALFLSAFGISALPEMLVGAALFSIAMGLIFAHIMRRWEPRRVIPAAFLLSGLMQVVEWRLSFVNSAAAAILVYLHMAAVGAALISGFWSVLNEKFDPYSGRRDFARIAAGGTIGGLLGGLIAGVLPSVMATTSMLPVLASFHLLCSGIIYGLSRRGRRDQRVAVFDGEPAEMRSGYAALRQSAYLQQIALVVLLGTISAAFLDYVFKAQAAASYKSSAELVRFFALFYAGTGFLTFIVQIALGRFSLERFGIARTVSTLPLGVLAGSVGNLVLPGVASSVIARGGEAVLRSSLFRSGYELLYTPVPENEKRPAKPLIDVVLERLGDFTGGVLINIALLWNIGAGLGILTALTLTIAGLQLFIATRLNREYVKALEHNLRNRAIHIDPASVRDRSTRDTLMRTFQAIQAAPPPAVPASTTLVRHSDPIMQRLLDLRSGDANRVRQGLKADQGLDELLVPQVIRLTGWDAVAEDAIQLLRQHVSSITGQLVDALTDPTQEVAVRRRIPRVLSTAPTQRSANGLFDGLSDSRFEVRQQCGRALAHIHEVNPELTFDGEKILQLIVRDIAIDKNVLLRQQLEREEQGNEDPQLGHIFRLLGLFLPTEPLRVAYRGLYSEDRALRGTSLEYLETILPDRVRNILWPLLELENIIRSLSHPK